ncbi:MAG: methionine aminopeptidase [Kineosporiaceae bacterium]|nr:methionine aminopeptidase [Kineosporiaceae bacterium]
MEQRYWYNLRTGQVETEADKSRGEDLMGPYPTHDAASRALQAARERTEKWDEEDRRWNEGDGED